MNDKQKLSLIHLLTEKDLDDKEVLLDWYPDGEFDFQVWTAGPTLETSVVVKLDGTIK